MKEEVFRFKKFELSHGRSSMKVGVDAVLLGTWVKFRGKDLKILDVGTGCGVISLILAQRFPGSKITAIDIDKGSIEEAGENFGRSEWKENLVALKMKYPEDLAADGDRYNLIVSNPPYFKSGISTPATSREKARHQGSLSVYTLIEKMRELLLPEGRLCVITPTEFLEEIERVCDRNGVEIKRVCYVRNNSNRPEKRMMLEMGLKDEAGEESEEEHLTLFESGIPTDAYRDLCRDFYLNF